MPNWLRSTSPTDFNKVSVPTSLGCKWWFHHICLPLYLYLMVFVIHSPCTQPQFSGITKPGTDKNNHGHMQANPHCRQSNNRCKFQKRLSRAPRLPVSWVEHAPDVTSKSGLQLCSWGWWCYWTLLQIWLALDRVHNPGLKVTSNFSLPQTARHGLIKFLSPSQAVSVMNSQWGHPRALPLHFLSGDRQGQI